VSQRYPDPQAELRALSLGLDQQPPTPRVTFEPSERGVLASDVAERLVSMTFLSRSNNVQPHIVTLHVDSSVTCTCPASTPCWATTAFRKVKGLYP